MYNRIICFIAIVCLTTACNDAATDTPRTDGFSAKPLTKEDSLHHEVMDGHDVGMAKIGRLKKYLVQIQHELDSISKQPAGQQDKQYQQMLLSLQKELSDAQNGMNTWMEKYNDDSANDNETDRIKYLESEKEKVGTVKKQILEGLQRADSLLKAR
jgi:hypothetical protein